LQVADPENEIGNDGSAGVEFETEKLMRVHGKAGVFEGLLRIAERLEGFKDFSFEALHVFEGDIEEVARTASGVEDAGRTELAMEGARCLNGCIALASFDLLGDHCLGAAPVVTERLDNRRDDETLDISARRVMGAQCVTFISVEGAFQQSTKDGRLNIAPARVRGLNEQAELVTGERKCLGRFEKPTVEFEDVRPEYGRKSAVVHGLPEGLGHGREVVNILPKALKQVEPTALGKQIHILGKRCEDTAGQEFGNLFRRVVRFKIAGKDSQFAGNFAGDFGGFA